MCSGGAGVDEDPTSMIMMPRELAAPGPGPGLLAWRQVGGTWTLYDYLPAFGAVADNGSSARLGYFCPRKKKEKTEIGRERDWYVLAFLMPD